MSVYDDPNFFDKYGQIERCKYGLERAGEWSDLKSLLPDFKGKRVLDLGCGYGLHCMYAAEHGATKVVGVDLSTKMIETAKSKSSSPIITYQVQNITEVDFPEDSFDVVISSLAFHYLPDFDEVVAKIKKFLGNEGDLVFAVENPIFTAFGTGRDYKKEDGSDYEWPIDKYFDEGKRNTNFLGHDIVKYHKTMGTYINALVNHGFKITKVLEPPKGDETETQKRISFMLMISARL